MRHDSGVPEDGTVRKYHMSSKALSGTYAMDDDQQTLTDTSCVVEDGRTIASFTKLLKEPGEIEILAGDNNYLLGAYGGRTALSSSHIQRHSVVLNLSSGTAEETRLPHMAAWVAHGALGFLAWGALVPFAVQASLWRAFLPKGPLWFKLHTRLNYLSYPVFAVAVAVAVAYTAVEGGNHFANSHQRMGLAMFVAATAQMINGVKRPATPAPGAKAPPVRKGWEVGHRVLGVGLLASGFWEMGDGIRLFAMKYSVSEGVEGKLTVAYWVWGGAMAALIFFGGCFRYRPVKKVEGPVGEAKKDVGKDAPMDDSKKATSPPLSEAMAGPQSDLNGKEEQEIYRGDEADGVARKGIVVAVSVAASASDAKPTQQHAAEGKEAGKEKQVIENGDSSKEFSKEGMLDVTESTRAFYEIFVKRESQHDNSSHADDTSKLVKI